METTISTVSDDEKQDNVAPLIPNRRISNIYEFLSVRSDLYSIKGHDKDVLINDVSSMGLERDDEFMKQLEVKSRQLEPPRDRRCILPTEAWDGNNSEYFRNMIQIPHQQKFQLLENENVEWQDSFKKEGKKVTDLLEVESFFNMIERSDVKRIWSYLDTFRLEMKAGKLNESDLKEVDFNYIRNDMVKRTITNPK